MPTSLCQITDRGRIPHKTILADKLKKELSLFNVQLEVVYNNNNRWDRLAIKLYMDDITRVSFRMHQLPGSCCWVVMSYLSHYPERLQVQLRGTEMIANYCKYGGILMTQTSYLKDSCVKVIMAEKYMMIGQAHNPHSSNPNYIYLRALHEAKPSFEARYACLFIEKS